MEEQDYRKILDLTPGEIEELFIKPVEDKVAAVLSEHPEVAEAVESDSPEDIDLATATELGELHRELANRHQALAEWMKFCQELQRIHGPETSFGDLPEDVLQVAARLAPFRDLV